MDDDQTESGEPGPGSDITDALDEIALLLEQLSALEAAKRQVPVGTATFVALAQDAVTAADRLARWTQLELRFGHIALEEATNGASRGLAETPRGRTLRGHLRRMGGGGRAA